MSVRPPAHPPDQMTGLDRSKLAAMSPGDPMRGTARHDSVGLSQEKPWPLLLSNSMFLKMLLGVEGDENAGGDWMRSPVGIRQLNEIHSARQDGIPLLLLLAGTPISIDVRSSMFHYRTGVTCVP